MRKLIIVVLFLHLVGVTSFVKSQNWLPVGGGANNPISCLFTDTVNNKLYAGGYFSSMGGVSTDAIAVWDGIKWDSIGSGLDIVRSITIFNNELYAGGSSGVNRWDGQTWIKLSNNYGDVYSDGTSLYAFGWFDSIGGIAASKIAKYNGISWSAIDTTTWYGGSIADVSLYKNKLYIGGNFNNRNGTIQRLAMFNGSQWEQVDNGIQGSIAVVNCFKIMNNILYLGGLFSKAQGNPGNSIAGWNGSNWIDMGDGISHQVFDLEIFHNQLHLAGNFTNAGGIPSRFYTRWDGSKWCALNDQFNNVGHALTVYNDTLYFAGGFTFTGTDSLKYIGKLSNDNIDTCSTSVAVQDYSWKESNPNLFPNPCNEYLSIVIPTDFSIASFEIYRFDGTILSVQKINSSKSEYNVTNLPSGLYPISIVIDGYRYWSKLLITH